MAANPKLSFAQEVVKYNRKSSPDTMMREYKTAYKKWQAAARSGDPVAQLEIGDAVGKIREVKAGDMIGEFVYKFEKTIQSIKPNAR